MYYAKHVLIIEIQYYYAVAPFNSHHYFKVH